MKNVTSILVMGIVLSGCAGPSTPFGARPLGSLFGKIKAKIFNRAPGAAEMAEIQFSPAHQILHGRSQLKMFITDPQGVRDDYEITVTYNGVDMSEKFMSQAKIEKSAKLLKIHFPNLRLPSDKDHDIEIMYARFPTDEYPVTSHYLSPQCHVFRPTPFKNTGEFKIAPRYVELVNDLSSKKNLNPNFLAGLIAQESGFDHLAVSRFKALGLTQVTSLGEAEIIDQYEDWPRYPEIREMSLPILKLNIMAGEINGYNEWRLDPRLSITGGAAYISHLDRYWRRPEAIQLIATNFSNPEDVLTPIILASYNSGAARVSRALKEYGTQWLNGEAELTEAKSYVNRVMSYCDYFSSGEGENESSP